MFKDLIEYCDKEAREEIVITKGTAVLVILVAYLVGNIVGRCFGKLWLKKKYKRAERKRQAENLAQEYDVFDFDELPEK